MNRQIKFRIWDENKKEFVKELFYDVMPKFMINLEYELDWIDDSFDGEFPSRYIIQQYTGGNDKNGKEIYEGDIIKYQGKVGIIEFFATMFICDWRDQTDDELAYMTIGDIEVVGNIFENSELC